MPAVSHHIDLSHVRLHSAADVFGFSVQLWDMGARPVARRSSTVVAWLVSV